MTMRRGSSTRARRYCRAGLFAAFLVAAFLAPHSVASAAPQCFGRAATVTGSGTVLGTSGDDVIVGSTEGDIIEGLEGDDLICALDGNDTIRAGLGNDKVDAGPGDDRVNGDPSSAGPVTGDGGNDYLLGGKGDDALRATTSPSRPRSETAETTISTAVPAPTVPWGTTSVRRWTATGATTRSKAATETTST
jgi:hypothetical protein